MSRHSKHQRNPKGIRLRTQRVDATQDGDTFASVAIPACLALLAGISIAARRLSAREPTVAH